MKRFFLLTASALALTGCAGMQQLSTDAVKGVIEQVSDVLTGPDSDYKNYLATCLKEYTAYIKAKEEEGSALKVGLASTHKEIAFGSLLMIAVNSGRETAPRCSVERKKGWLESGNIFDVALRVYEENRRNVRARKQLESDEKRDLRRMDVDLERNRQLNDLLTTLSGDKLQLQNSTQDNDYRRAQLPAAD